MNIKLSFEQFSKHIALWLLTKKPNEFLGIVARKCMFFCIDFFSSFYHQRRPRMPMPNDHKTRDVMPIFCMKFFFQEPFIVKKYRKIKKIIMVSFCMIFPPYYVVTSSSLCNNTQGWSGRFLHPIHNGHTFI